MSARLSRQSENLSNCGPDEYWSGDHCCKNCRAGEFVQRPCNISHTLGQCGKCQPGTFTRASNGLESCIPCSSCDERQEMVAECSATINRKCQCQAGHFYFEPESSEVCRRCTKCPQGTPVLQACNSTANTVCGQTTTNHRNRLYLLLIVFTILIIIAVYRYLKKERSCRCLSDELTEGTAWVCESKEGFPTSLNPFLTSSSRLLQSSLFFLALVFLQNLKQTFASLHSSPSLAFDKHSDFLGPDSEAFISTEKQLHYVAPY
ncbi:tumor necrosis factor receptor superfamily member 22-like [Onychomys torridus]|uniref:tumor necrosis factor receptor superfamily member 22-like n=1 Tax=Onychomys torridus TaxID=38674 RepID=UPI00167F8C84|nr:tumor necrosis factor receptor superfamily member 22-like [Onychomys torridus]